MQSKNKDLDDDTLFDIDLLMVDSEFGGQQWDDSGGQGVVSKFSSEQTVQVVQLDSTVDDIQVEIVSGGDTWNSVENGENGVEPENVLGADLKFSVGLMDS